ncbi:MAG: DsbA family protein, partial [Leeuwenhoekiella sp.]|nr:DsbA family protein [Leeuwenhoekiella sp.]
RKGMNAEQAQNAIDHVNDYAKATGLDFDYDKVIVANTHKGHQLIHLAGQQGLQDAMKERLLKAYFIDGLNVDDTNVLVQLGVEVGLTEEAIHTELREENFAAFIEQDIAEAQQCKGRAAMQMEIVIKKNRTSTFLMSAFRILKAFFFSAR